ncbi:MAG: transporter [Methylibium sp. NZG]|nr:MAG: transporter [Methylibium sp. NZG]
MQAIFAVTFPFFALVLLGYLAAQRRVLPEAAIPGLNMFVLFFALPCMLFRFGASRPFGQLIDPVLLGIYGVSALLMVVFSIALTLQRVPGDSGVPLKDAAFGALVATFPNAGFMGVPLLVGLLGERAAGPLIGAILLDLVVTSSLCLALAQMQPSRGSGPGAGLRDGVLQDRDPQASDAHDSVLAAFLRALRGALSNPLPWAIGLGALVAASGLALPEPLLQIIKMLGDAATPVALFTIGAVLWRAGQHTHTATPVARYLPLALVKLLVHPLLVLSAGVVAQAMGLAVSHFGLMVLVLTAALPSASNVSILAERYGADNGRIARIIMASTVLAFGTFSVFAWAMGAGLP